MLRERTRFLCHEKIYFKSWKKEDGQGTQKGKSKRLDWEEGGKRVQGEEEETEVKGIGRRFKKGRKKIFL